MTIKYDHRGGVVDTGDATTVERDGVTHWIFAPTQVCQLLTRCGRRGLGVLGRGEVDCPKCLDDL